MSQAFLFVMLVSALAATVQASTGFGFNLLAAPILVAFYDSLDVVPALHIVWLPLGAALWIHHRKQVEMRRVWMWLVPAIPFTFAGVWLLKWADPAILKRFIGSVTLLTVAAIALNVSRPVRRERLWMTLTGALSGLLGGATAMSGPPVLLLGLNQRWPAETFRPTLLAYFTLLGIVAVATLAVSGTITETSLRFAAAGLPGLVVGFFVGTWLARHLVGKRFRYAVIGLLVVVGVLPWVM